MDNWGDSGGFGGFGQKEHSRREKLEIDYDEEREIGGSLSEQDSG